MAPSNEASAPKKLWFVFPWKFEKQDPKHLAYQPASTLESGLDGDVECKRARLQSFPEVGLESWSIPNPNNLLEDDIFDDGVVCLPVLEEKTRNVFIEF
jgi:hypothetical protein